MSDLEQPQPGLKENFLSFLNSPEALGLAQGLLSASRDQYGRPQKFGTALGQGLLSMQKAGDADAIRQLHQAQATLARQKAAEPARQAALEKERMGMIRGLLEGKLGGELPFSEDQLQQAGIVGILGGTDAMLDVLKKTEAVPTNIQMKLAQADNVEKTLDSIIFKDLVQYSGGLGAIQEGIQRNTPGLQTDNYSRYTKEKSKAELAASQLRAFYGDSIKTEMLDRLEKLVDPSGFNLSPKQAEENARAIVRIIKSEGDTYRDIARKIKPGRYKNKPVNSSKSLGDDPMEVLEK